MRRSLVGSVVAVALVVGFVGVVQAWGGPVPASGPGFVVTPTVVPTVAPPSLDRAAASTAAPQPGRTRSPQRPALVVLNNSRVPGLAARAAAGFRAGGWPVTRTANLSGRFRATTVYFAPGQEAAARALADGFPAIRRVLPRLPGLPADAPLAVVVTRDLATG